MFNLSDYLKEYRRERGLSYANFSKECFDGELSPQTLMNLEIGLGEPRISTLKIISLRLGIDKHELAHFAFDIPELNKIGELDESQQVLLDIWARMTKGEREILISFARFLLEERYVRENVENAIARESANSDFRGDQGYILSFLNGLEEDWGKFEEENNPFA